jgi:hypothetical protein
MPLAERTGVSLRKRPGYFGAGSRKSADGAENANISPSPRRAAAEVRIAPRIARALAAGARRRQKLYEFMLSSCGLMAPAPGISYMGAIMTSDSSELTSYYTGPAMATRRRWPCCSTGTGSGCDR